MELQERAKEEKELVNLRKVIDEQIDNLNKSKVTYEFLDLLLRYEEFEKQMGKFKYFESLAKSAYNVALDYVSIASKSPYVRELAIIHFLLSRLYADIASAILKEVNLDSIILDIIKFSFSLINFPLLVNAIQKLWKMSKKIDNITFDHQIKAQLKEDLKELEFALKGKYIGIEEFDDGIFIDINREEAFDNEIHEAMVEVFRDKNRKIVAIDITYEDKED